VYTKKTPKTSTSKKSEKFSLRPVNYNLSGRPLDNDKVGQSV